MVETVHNDQAVTCLGSVLGPVPCREKCLLGSRVIRDYLSNWRKFGEPDQESVANNVNTGRRPWSFAHHSPLVQITSKPIHDLYPMIRLEFDDMQRVEYRMSHGGQFEQGEQRNVFQIIRVPRKE